MVSWISDFLASLFISDNECLSQFAKMEQGVLSPPASRKITVIGVAASHWMTLNHQQARARCSHSHLLQHGMNPIPSICIFIVSEG